MLSVQLRAPAIALILACAPAAFADVKQPPVKRGVPPAAVPRPSPAAEVAEAEPNDAPAQAQAVGCGNALRPARLVRGAGPDEDWVSFAASAGDLLSVTTASDSLGEGLGTDTILSLYAPDGVTILAVNDDAGSSRYSAIRDVEAPASGIYYARVRGFDGAEGPYRLDVACQPAAPPPTNERCDSATPIARGDVRLSGNTRFAADDYDLCPGVPECPASCTGFHTPGRDVVFRVDAMEAGEEIDVTFSFASAALDAALYLVTDCGQVAASCVAGRDGDEPSPAERLTHVFAAPGTYYLVLDSFSSEGGAWTLEGCLACPTSAVPVSWGRLKIIYR